MRNLYNNEIESWKECSKFIPGKSDKSGTAIIDGKRHQVEIINPSTDTIAKYFLDGYESLVPEPYIKVWYQKPLLSMTYSEAAQILKAKLCQ